MNMLIFGVFHQENSSKSGNTERLGMGNEADQNKRFRFAHPCLAASQNTDRHTPCRCCPRKGREREDGARPRAGQGEGKGKKKQTATRSAVTTTKQAGFLTAELNRRSARQRETLLADFTTLTASRPRSVFITWNPVVGWNYRVQELEDSCVG